METTAAILLNNFANVTPAASTSLNRPGTSGFARRLR